MRRKDREVTDNMEIVSIIKSCKVCRLGMWDGNEVYVVPLNFGYLFKDDRLVLYFHSAGEGRKLDLLRQAKSVCFELDCNHELIEGEKACSFGFRFSSIIGTGTVSFLTNETDKAAALSRLMLHQTGHAFSFSPEMTRSVTVFQVTSEHFSCKQHL